MHTDTYDEYGMHVTRWDYDCTLRLLRAQTLTHEHIQSVRGGKSDRDVGMLCGSHYHVNRKRGQTEDQPGDLLFSFSCTGLESPG